jgi:hypothetical protein
MNPKEVRNISELPYVDLEYIHVDGKDQARSILENGEYTAGWFYASRTQKTLKWLIVKQSEYERNQY